MNLSSSIILAFAILAVLGSSCHHQRAAATAARVVVNLNPGRPVENGAGLISKAAVTAVLDVARKRNVADVVKQLSEGDVHVAYGFKGSDRLGGLVPEIFTKKYCLSTVRPDKLDEIAENCSPTSQWSTLISPDRCCNAMKSLINSITNCHCVVPILFSRRDIYLAASVCFVTSSKCGDLRVPRIQDVQFPIIGEIGG